MGLHGVTLSGNHGGLKKLKEDHKDINDCPWQRFQIAHKVYLTPKNKNPSTGKSEEKFTTIELKEADFFITNIEYVRTFHQTNIFAS